MLRPMTWYRRHLSIMYDILSLNKLNTLNCWYDSLIHKKPVPIHDSHSSFCKNMFIHLQVQCHRPSISPPAFPLNLTLYLGSSLESVIREPILYKLLTFHNPNLISIFRCLGRLSNQVEGSIAFFATSSFFMLKGYYISPTPSPKLEDNPFVVCPRLLIQNICSCPL
jgi:hypothetical protein